MRDVEQIRGEDDLRQWLRALQFRIDVDLPELERRQVSVAYRMAMRVLPVYWLWSLSGDAQTHQADLCIQALRAAVSVGVAANNGKTGHARENDLYSGVSSASTGTKGRAHDAARAMVYATHTAASLASRVASSAMRAGHEHDEQGQKILNYTGTLADYASQTVPEIWESVLADCRLLAEGETLDGQPLWLTRNPVSGVWDETRESLTALGPGWGFWADWYIRALDGQQDWALQEKIAEIPHTDWRRGADHVNGLIAKLGRGFTPVPEPEAKLQKPAPPRLSDVERSHFSLVLAVPDASIQSADYLADRFESIEQAYRRAFGCPNATPPELDPLSFWAHAADPLPGF